ncbi:hypothetical protein OROMI_019031 [Orobanche minor]
MAIEAWFMEDNDEDQRLPHHSNPKEFVSPDHLTLDPNIYENDKELQKIRQERGYNYMDVFEKLDIDQLRIFYIEHIHVDEEIRYCLEESGYFDVRDKEDRWIQIWIKPGDLIILSSSIYHRFTLDTTDYIKADDVVSGRTSIPVCTAYNRPQDNHHLAFISLEAVLLFEQKSSDLAKKEEVKRGFTSAMMLPLGQGLLCATVDLHFLIYGVEKLVDGGLNLFMRKRLIGYNEEIADMKCLGEEEQFLAVATSVEQPPRTWIKAQLESRELLTFCVKRLKNVNKVRFLKMY